MNTGEPLLPSLDEAQARVLGIQTKLHQWAGDDGDRRFDDLFNLVCDPAFLVVACNRVRGNRGARSGGVDGIAPRSVVFADSMLLGLRAELKARTFEPLPVKERMIPKTSGKVSSSRDPRGAGLDRASQLEAGPRTHLRSGLPPMQRWVPSASSTP